MDTEILVIRKTDKCSREDHSKPRPQYDSPYNPFTPRSSSQLNTCRLTSAFEISLRMWQEDKGDFTQSCHVQALLYAEYHWLVSQNRTQNVCHQDWEAGVHESPDTSTVLPDSQCLHWTEWVRLAVWWLQTLTSPPPCPPPHTPPFILPTPPTPPFILSPPPLTFRFLLFLLPFTHPPWFILLPFFYFSCSTSTFLFGYVFCNSLS